MVIRIFKSLETKRGPELEKNLRCMVEWGNYARLPQTSSICPSPEKPQEVSSEEKYSDEI